MILSHPIENADLMADGAVAEGWGARSRSSCRSGARRRSWWTARAQRPRKPRPADGRGAGAGQAAGGLAEAFGLDAPPVRIEVYDNSHIQGAMRWAR
jgi:excinuclease ABC subunit C